MRKTALWAVIAFAAISAAAAPDVPADTAPAGYSVYNGGELEEDDNKKFWLAVPAPPWLGPSGGYLGNRGAVGLACSYSRPRFEVRADGRYYFPRGN